MQKTESGIDRKSCATGDLLIRGIMTGDPVGVRKVIEYMNEADIKVTDPETTVTNGDRFPVCCHTKLRINGQHIEITLQQIF